MEKDSSLIAGIDPVPVKAVLLATSFVAMLNETAINVCLSDLMSVFGVPVSSAQWLVTGFMLVMAVVVPATAFILQSYSTRRVYFGSLSLLAAGSLLCGAAPSFSVLFIGRLVQAAGTCCLMALTMTSVIQLTPPEKRGGAMGLVNLVCLFAPAVAPSLAGFALERIGWRSVFLGPLVLFVLLGAGAARYLRNITIPRKLRLDAFSLLLAAVGFGGLLYAVSSIPHLSGRRAQLLVPLALGLAALSVFVVRQLSQEEPLLDVRVFKYPMFALGMVSVFFGVLSAFGIIMLTPLFLIRVLGLGTAAAGLSMLPGGLLNGLASPLFGKLYDRWGPRGLVITGTALMAAGGIVFSRLPGGIPTALYIAVHCVTLIAFAMIMTVSQTNGVNELPPRLYPHGTAVMSTLMQFGGGFGSALYVALLSGAGTVGMTVGGVSGFHRAFLFGAALMAIPLAASFFVRRPFGVAAYGSVPGDEDQTTAV